MENDYELVIVVLKRRLSLRAFRSSSGIRVFCVPTSNLSASDLCLFIFCPPHSHKQGSNSLLGDRKKRIDLLTGAISKSRPTILCVCECARECTPTFGSECMRLRACVSIVAGVVVTSPTLFATLLSDYSLYSFD